MTVIKNVPHTGPFGDARNLRITIADGRIEVINTLASEGNRLEVDRPIYGYELHLAGEIDRLRGLLDEVRSATAMPLPNPGAHSWGAFYGAACTRLTRCASAARRVVSPPPLQRQGEVDE